MKRSEAGRIVETTSGLLPGRWESGFAVFRGIPYAAVPVGWRLHRNDEMISITGIRPETTKKFRDIARTYSAAIVIDDVLPPWQPRGIEIRGRAEALTGSEPLIGLHSERIIAWGLDETDRG